MKILERYVLKAFLTAFALTWLVLTFVLTIGLLVKITRLLIEGLPFHAVGTLMLVGLPETLKLTVPLALLVSSLLIFSRLSADSEIAAMRACGVNLLSVMRGPLLFGLFCALFGIYINNEIVPRSHEVGRNLQSIISVDVGLELLEPGRMIDDFDEFKIFFEKKEGNWIHSLLIFDYSDTNVTREISAEKALVSTNGTDIVLDLYKVRMDPVDVDRPGIAAADRLQHVIPEALKQRKYSRKEKDFRYRELTGRIAEIRRNPEKLAREVRRRMLSKHRTEYHLRLVYALAAICFVLVGVPLGIKSQRKESTIGMAISLVVAMVYYLFVILVYSLDKYDKAYPYVLVWIPVVICGVLASWLIPKNL